MSASVSSATAAAFAPGVLVTVTPCRSAASQVDAVDADTVPRHHAQPRRGQHGGIDLVEAGQDALHPVDPLAQLRGGQRAPEVVVPDLAHGAFECPRGTRTIAR